MAVYDELYFIFNGVDCRDVGVRVTELPPRVMPQRRYTEHTVPGRDGVVRSWDGAYESVQMPVRVYIPYAQGVAGVSALSVIANWLDGEGWLELSDRPGLKYDATVTLETQYTAWLQAFEDIVATVTFTAEPYAYLTGEHREDLSDSGVYIDNPGNCDAAPVISVWGSGSFNLMIGQQILEFDGVTDAGDDPAVVINSDLGDCYRGDTSMNNLMTGDFPMLTPGQNAVSWVVPTGMTGQVSRVVIEKNPRNRF